MKKFLCLCAFVAKFFVPELCLSQDLFYVKGSITVKPSSSVSIKGGIIASGSALINNDGTITVANHSTKSEISIAPSFSQRDRYANGGEQEIKIFIYCSLFVLFCGCSAIQERGQQVLCSQ